MAVLFGSIRLIEPLPSELTEYVPLPVPVVAVPPACWSVAGTLDAQAAYPGDRLLAASRSVSIVTILCNAQVDAPSQTCCTGQNCQPTPHQAYGAGLWNSPRGFATSDDVIIHRHCTSSRQGTPASDACAVIQGDAVQRENVPYELSGCTESRGAANHPKHVLIWTIGKNNRRAACGRERTTYLKNEHCIAVTVVVESQLTRQPRGSSKKIYAVRESLSTQVLTRQGASARLAHCHVERCGQIALSLNCGRVTCVGRSVHDPRRKAGYRATWADT